MSSELTYTDPRLVAVFRRFAALAALISAAIGAAALAAWAIGLGPATALIPGEPPLPPLTALGLLLAGVALWLLRPPGAAEAPLSRLRRRLGLICAGVAAALGGLVLLEYLMNVDLGLDRALFSQALALSAAAHPGRPGPAAAANLLLCGLALLALEPAVAQRLPRWLPAAGLVLALALSSLGLLSYTFETTTASPLAAHLPIEPSSALGWALLALGALAATPTGPLTGTLTSSLAGGSLTRRFLPAAILLPFITGWLRVIGLQRGVVDIGLGAALTSTASIVAYCGVAYWTARNVNRTDARRAAAHQALLESEERLRAELAERQRTEAALRQSEERFAKAFYASPAGVTFIRRSDQRYVDVNDRFLELLQFQRADVIGHTTLELDLYPDPAVRADLVARIGAAGGVRNVALELRAKTGELRSVLYSGEQILLDGEPHTLGIVIDDTEHHRADEALRQLNAQLEARVADRTAELAASEAQLRALFEVLPVGVSILDAQRRVRQSNPALARVMRLSSAALASGSFNGRPTLRPDGSAMPPEEFASAVAAREQRPVLDAEMGVVLEGGQTLWLDVNAAPLPNGEVVVITSDVTARKQAAAALRESEQKFSKAFHTSAAGMVITRAADGRLLEVNDGFLALIGFTREAVIGHTTQELGVIDGDYRQLLRQTLAAEGRLPEMEMALITRTGETKTTLTSIESIRLGSEPCWLSLHLDITERKRAEAALMAGEQRNRELFEAERRQAQELTLRDLMHTALARELPLPEILRILVDGIAHTMGYTQVSLYLLEGELLRLQHQVGYDQVIETVHISSGVSGRVVRTRQPVLVADVRDDPDFLGAIAGIHSEICVPLFEQGRVAGVLNLESTHGVPLTEADLRLLVALGAQVDFALGRARLAAQARESQQRFASAFNNAPIGITLVSPAGGFLQVNPALCRLVGYSEAELLVRTFQELTHPDDLETDLALLREVLSGARQSYQMEKRYFHKRGHIVWILLSVSLVRGPDGQPLYFISQIEDISERKAAEVRLAAQAQVLASERDLMQALMDSIPDTIYFKDTASRFTRINRAQAEFLHLPSPEAAVGKTDLDFHEPALARDIFDEEQNRVLQGRPLVNRIDQVTGPDGQPRWMSSTKVALRDAAGHVTGLVGISRDITAVKQAEARLLGSLQEKEVLLKEIHHRVKNNLQVVSSLLRLQAESLADPELRDAFEDSQRRVRSMALVHEQLYRSSDLAHIDFAEYLTGLVNYLRRSHARPLHSLRLRVEVADITLEIDRAIPLGLLVNELVTNSLKYAFPAERPDAEIWVTAARDPAGALVLAVGDNGVGLPETVDVEQTASMGWQLVQSFVAQVHGRYTLQRQPGTVFTLVIPERAAAAAEAPG